MKKWLGKLYLELGLRLEGATRSLVGCQLRACAVTGAQTQY